MACAPDAVQVAGRPLGAERHVCAFFHTRDEEYRTLLPFVEEGFAHGEKAIHIVDPALRADHLARLAGVGIDVATEQRRRRLEVLDWRETYLRDRSFNRRTTSAQLEAMLRRTREEGFPRARVIGHGEWALTSAERSAAVVEYEARMNDVLAAYDDPVVCAYDRSALPCGMMMDLLRAHPATLLDGALQANPCFLPPARLLPRLRGRPLGLLRERFQTALISGAGREALDIVLDEALAEVPVSRIYLDVLQATLYEIGRLWQEKKVSETQEHLATEVVRGALAHLRELLPSRPSSGHHVVVACVEGEFHDLGARMVADFLEMAGCEVTFLGANVPTASLVRLVQERRPALLALSATTHASLQPLRHALAAVRRGAGRNVRIAVGGRLFLERPALVRRLRIAHARYADEAAVAVRRWLHA